MKKITAIIALTFGLIAGLQAQTNQNFQNFITQAFAWGTSLNTNIDENWTNSTLDVDVGLEQVTGEPATSVAGFQYAINSSRFEVGADIQYFGVGSAINSAEGSIGYAIIKKYDLKIAIEARAGYDWNNHDTMIEPGLWLKKVMTKYTFAEIGASLPCELRQTFQRNPTFYVQTGARF